jgi:Rieske Fe-S protein
MQRKEFILTCGYACLAASSLGVILGACGTNLYYARHSEAGNKLAIAKTEFIVPSENTFRKFVLIKTARYNFPIGIFRISETEYSALLMECTHNGCELKAQGDFLLCPCHGSEFSNKGVVQNPPAETNLKTFETSLDNTTIYVQV